MANDLVEAGYIVKTHGYRGDLRIRFLDGITLSADLPRAFFILHREEHLPYFTTSLSYTAENEAIVHFEGLEDKETAATFKGDGLFLERQYVTESPVMDEDGAGRLIGYTVYDRALGEIGEVEAVEAYPQQDMLVVRSGARRILIPARPELIPETDDDKRLIFTELPDGFLDI